MAKKDHREIIPPYKCIQALELFHEKLMSYKMTFDMLLEYVENTPNKNKGYQDHLIKTAKEYQQAIREYNPQS